MNCHFGQRRWVIMFKKRLAQRGEDRDGLDRDGRARVRGLQRPLGRTNHHHQTAPARRCTIG